MSLTFDGHNLESLFMCGDPSRTVLNVDSDIREIKNRNGSAFIGMSYNDSTVSFTIVATGTIAQRMEKFGTLGQWLMVDEPKQLVLPDLPNKYYLAVPSGALDVQRAINADYATLTFDIVDPVAYGESHTVTLTPSDLSANLTIGGTAPTALDFTIYGVVRDESSQLFALRAASKYVAIYIPSSSSTLVYIRGSSRSCTVAGNTRTLTLTSVWPDVNPGTARIQLATGTFSSMTVSWVDRWY